MALYFLSDSAPIFANFLFLQSAHIPLPLFPLHVFFYITNHIRSESLGTIVKELMMVSASCYSILLDSKTALRTVHDMHDISCPSTRSNCPYSLSILL